MELTKGRFLSETKIEVIVAIMLGVTALFSAWAGWIGSLHGGNQATNYTVSNNLASEGNSEYVAGLQLYNSDMSTWTQINSLMVDLYTGSVTGEVLESKVTLLLENCANPEFVDAVDWAMDQSSPEKGIVSPFTKPGFSESYFVASDSLITQSQEVLEQGKADNTNGDTYNLVTVIYTVILFMLGIIGTFKKVPNREIILAFSVVMFLATTIFMLTLPMPTGFSLFSFF